MHISEVSKLTKTQEAILRELASHVNLNGPDWASFAEIARALKSIPRSTVSNALHSLAKWGLVRTIRTNGDGKVVWLAEITLAGIGATSLLNNLRR